MFEVFNTAKRQYTNLWKVVKQVIRDHYDDLADLRMRDSYYVVRDYLSGDLGEAHIGTDMTQEDYDWFLTNQGYSSYRDDIWTWLEQNEGLERPRAIPEGVIWDNGEMYTMAEWEEEGIDFIWERARGFIFSEKRGPATDIGELSEFGWTIVTVGKGFPTRLVRELLKEDDRPVLALHDCDTSGEGIFRALGFKTRRTTHLDIALGDRVTDLGMSDHDVEILNLPSQPESPKFRNVRERRYEINALIVLKKRMGVENPVLEYVIAKMEDLGIIISQLEVEKRELWETKVRVTVDIGISRAVSKLVKKLSKGYDLKGTAVKLEAEREKILADLPGLEEIVKSVMEKLSDDMYWIYENDRNLEAIEKVTPELRDLILGLNGGDD